MYLLFFQVSLTQNNQRDRAAYLGGHVLNCFSALPLPQFGEYALLSTISLGDKGIHRVIVRGFSWVQQTATWKRIIWCVCVCLNNSGFLRPKAQSPEKPVDPWNAMRSWGCLELRTGMNVFTLNGESWDMFEPLLVSAVTFFSSLDHWDHPKIFIKFHCVKYHARHTLDLKKKKKNQDPVPAWRKHLN